MHVLVWIMAAGLRELVGKINEDGFLELCRSRRLCITNLLSRTSTEEKSHGCIHDRDNDINLI